MALRDFMQFNKSRSFQNPNSTLNCISRSLSFLKTVLEQLASALSCTINLFQKWLDYSPKQKKHVTVSSTHTHTKKSFPLACLAVTTLFCPILQQNFRIIFSPWNYSLFFNPLTLFSLGRSPYYYAQIGLSSSEQQYFLTAKSRTSVVVLFTGLSQNLTQLLMFCFVFEDLRVLVPQRSFLRRLVVPQ